MIPSVSIGPRTLMNDCNHSTTAIFWRSAILRVNETQSFMNRDWLRPGLHGILDVRADACLPSSHPLCAGKQRVGSTTTKSH